MTVFFFQGCAFGTIDFSDNRKIVIEPKHIEVSGDIEPWDWANVYTLYHNITKE